MKLLKILMHMTNQYSIQLFREQLNLINKGIKLQNSNFLRKKVKQFLVMQLKKLVKINKLS
jgi:hypothetical protein